MTALLFIGANGNLQLDWALEDTCVRLTTLGIPMKSDDLVAMKVDNGREVPHLHGYLENDFYVKLMVQGVPSHVHITQSPTEIVPGYSEITDLFTISVGVWVGASRLCRLISACLAAAIAAQVRGMILDSEHLWCHKDLNELDEFMECVKKGLDPAAIPPSI